MAEMEIVQRAGYVFAVILGLGAGLAHAADPAAGGAVFKAQCAICHSPEAGKNRTGPSLFGIVGRPSGQVPNFHYSDANQKAKLIWDQATLDKYLTAPKTVVPGTTMAFPGLKNDAQRADLIAYLTTLH